MSDIVKRLRDRRANVWEQAKEIAERAAEENRQFTAEEQGQWDAMNGELDALDTRIKSALDTEERAKSANEAFERIHGRPQERGSQPEEQQASQLRAWMRGEGPRFFDVRPDGPLDIRKVQQRALSVGTDTAGGDTVPTTFYNRLVEHLIQNASIMQTGVTVIQTAGGEVIQVPKTTAHSSASIVTEGNAIGESDPAVGQVSLGAYKYGTLIQVSRELLDDAGVDLEGYLAREAGRALGNAFGAHAITGDGSSKPRGVVTDATQGVTNTAGTGAFAPTYDNVVDLFHSVIAPYRQSRSCYWVLNDTTVGTLRKIVTSGSGEPIWQPSMQLGAPDMLLGKPMITDPNVAAVAASAKSVLFGDFSTYFVRLAGGIRFERSDEYAFNTDLVTFRALLRADGALVDLTGSVKYFAAPAT